MTSEALQINENSTVAVPGESLYITVRRLYFGKCEVILGYPASPNREHEMKTGDVAIYEAGAGVRFEVRALSITPGQAEFLATRMSAAVHPSRPPLKGPQENERFSPEEVRKIEGSLDDVKEEVRRSGQFNAAQLLQIDHKLDELLEASNRLGRKDWAAFFLATAVTLGVSAVFTESTRQYCLRAMGAAFSWMLELPADLLLLN